jgi:hypothetical protein
MTAREAWQALRRRRDSMIDGLTARALEDGGALVMSVSEVREAIKRPRVGLDVPAELEEVAAESIMEQRYVEMIFGFLHDADPSLAGHAIASVLCMVFEDGYIVRALQEEGRADAAA